MIAMFGGSAAPVNGIIRSTHMRALLFSAVSLIGACGSFQPSPHAPFPQVSTTDGAVLAPLTLVTVVTEGEPLEQSLFDFGDALIASDWWRVVGGEYGLGAAAGSARIVGPAIGADVADHDLFTYLDNVIQSHNGPFKNGNTLYLLYLPSGISVISNDVVNTDCKLYGGYHRAFGLKGDNMAVIQRCSADEPLEQLTATASHEVIEAATDPTGRGFSAGLPPRTQPWTASVWQSYFLRGRAEVGDLCDGTRIVEGAFTYQRVFSNRAAAGGGDPCLPAIGDPYYNVNPMREWYPVAAGQSIWVSTRGWSTAPATPWNVSTGLQGSIVGFGAGSPSVAVTVQNDTFIDFTVSAPPEATSGSYAVIETYSQPIPPIGSDLYHLQTVGVYVP
jgi:hypothetical protein